MLMPGAEMWDLALQTLPGERKPWDRLDLLQLASIQRSYIRAGEKFSGCAPICGPNVCQFFPVHDNRLTDLILCCRRGVLFRWRLNRNFQPLDSGHLILSMPISIRSIRQQGCTIQCNCTLRMHRISQRTDRTVLQGR